MRFSLFSSAALALVVTADQSVYYVEENISCTLHEATGVTNCEPGHLSNAESVNASAIVESIRTPG